MLGDHPAVTEVCVIPRPDDVMGEVGVAVVVPTDASAPPSLDQLRAFAGERLAHHKLPEHVLLRDSLPRNASDKVDRRRLVADDSNG